MCSIERGYLCCNRIFGGAHGERFDLRLRSGRAYRQLGVARDDCNAFASGAGRPRKYPCALLTPNERSTLSSDAVSTPSATILLPVSWANRMRPQRLGLVRLPECYLNPAGPPFLPHRQTTVRSCLPLLRRRVLLPRRRGP